MFHFNTLSNERLRAIRTTCYGSYTLNLSLSVDTLFAASSGYSRDLLAKLADKYIIFESFYDEDGVARFRPLEEMFADEATRTEIRGGSFRKSALFSRLSWSWDNGIFDRFVAICPDCGRVFSVTPEAHECGTVFCHQCGNDLDRDGRCTSDDCQQARLATVYNYHRRPNKYNPFFERPSERADFIHLGAEVEIAGSSSFEVYASRNNTIARQLSKAINAEKNAPALVEFEEDGSLNNGVECIFRPLTFKGYEKREKMIDEFYKTARDLGGGFDRLNGLHVHIDRAALGKDTERRALSAILIELMVYKYFDFFATISRRPRGHFGYATKKDGIDGVFTACTHAANQEHSHAVNGSGSATVELRIFGGKIDNGDEFLAVLDITQAIAKWARQATLGTADRATPCDLVKHLKNHRRVLSFVENIRPDAPRTRSGDADLEAFVLALKVKLGEV